MTGSRRPWLVPVAIAVIAVGLLIAGIVTWQMTSSGGHCPVNARCAFKPHRHHPLRAELLWAASALLAIIAAEIALWQRRQIPVRRSPSR
jgi:predicted small integral membrane protein